ncbi:hypothetical protein [Micromonospora sp. CB01531]|uniref:hypothetical protein n=1 Tax=Micromonospora sp. CB01531 TaxID=1718947 RepID=UPI000939A5E7|nr:hypothetical protein [Micromonospora sp. CB01531]OKI45122.1 hypothetical protein A6A27_11960 [Micromonospora sp. CB01531]
MKIVQAHTGAAAVPVPEKDVVLIDPAIGQYTAIDAIQAVLPTHRELVEHWVVTAGIPIRRPEAVTQIIPAVARQYRPVRPIDIKPGRHRAARPRRQPVNVAALGRRAGSLTAAAVLGGVLVPMFAGGTTPVAANQAWHNQVFSAMQTGSSWTCAGLEDADLKATCITEDGTTMQVEAYMGPDSVHFVFSYGEERNEVKVFADAGAHDRWDVGNPAHHTLPNLVEGERWVIYGTDEARISRWAAQLDDRVVLPDDVTEAAIALALLPEPGTEPVTKQPRTVKEQLRVNVQRIVAGDPTLPAAVTPPIGPSSPDMPLPAPPVLSDTMPAEPAPNAEPVESAPVETAPSAPAPAPAPVVTAPAPAPVETAPTSSPVVTAPVEATEPTATPDPLTDPIVVPQDEAIPMAEETALAIGEPEPPIFGQLIAELAHHKDVVVEGNFGQLVQELRHAA